MAVQIESCFSGSHDHLLAELKRIEFKLELCLLQIRQDDIRTPKDEFHGFYISDEVVAKSGLKTPFENPDSFQPDLTSLRNINESLKELEQSISERKQKSLNLGHTLRLQELAGLFHLSQFEIDTLLICLLPELNTKYQQTYAYLQDDITKKSATVDLVLRLLCETFEDYMKKREIFSAGSSLIKYHLINLNGGPASKLAPLLSKSLQIDERIISFLLGTNCLDEQLVSLASLIQPKNNLAEMILPDSVKDRFTGLLKEARDKGIIFYFQGAHGAGKLATAQAICSELGKPLLTVDISKILTADISLDQLIPLIFREGLLQGAALYFRNFDLWPGNEKITALYNSFLITELREYPFWVFLAGEKEFQPSDAHYDKPFINTEFPVPSFSERKQLWEKFWVANSDVPDGLNFADLAGTFRLTGGQIGNVIAAAKNLATWRNPLDITITTEDVYAACRKQFRETLNTLAHKIKPTYSWNDIVLPKDQMEQLHEICSYMKHYNTVYGDWGFGRRISLGKGLNVLFAGPSGTGKTMSAEILANELRLDLYKIDLSMIVSKYIGETEKNLDRIFREGQTSNAILFFDEADAIFGKRSEVRDSHDRYANIEVAYLLQKMEEYDGVVILATNLRKNMDEAFARRMHFVLEFPIPEEFDRHRIWKSVFPGEAPLSSGIDFVFMARQFKITGGNIKNIALSAAFLAADNGGTIKMEHLIRATKREYQKTGKLCTEVDFGEYYELVKR